MSTPEAPTGKFKKAVSMTAYLSAMLAQGRISESEVKRLLARGENKRERLQAWHLPTLRTTGPQNTCEDALERVPQDRWHAEKFYVRCLPKDLRTGLKLERNIMPFDHISQFVNALPRGQENYTIEISESWDPEYSGTITANGEGSILIEQGKMKHADLETSGMEKMSHARYDGTNGIHFNYSSTTEAEKEIMLGALRYLIPELSREQLDDLKVYAEYIYHPKYGYRFYEVDDDDFWTNR